MCANVHLSVEFLLYPCKGFDFLIYFFSLLPTETDSAFEAPAVRPIFEFVEARAIVGSQRIFLRAQYEKVMYVASQTELETGVGLCCTLSLSKQEQRKFVPWSLELSTCDQCLTRVARRYS